jgi:hypothetical protein
MPDIPGGVDPHLHLADACGATNARGSGFGRQHARFPLCTDKVPMRPGWRQARAVVLMRLSGKSQIWKISRTEQML